MIKWVLFLFIHHAYGKPLFQDPDPTLDPEINMTTPEIIAYWGYPAEIHAVTTDDGYILEMHRIPHGKQGIGKCPNRPVVFMQHGLESASHDWVINLPSESPGYYYADHGFDVWLGNFRGNTYGKKHVNLTVANNPKFWSFSWDEMTTFDLPAMIDYVLAETNQSSLYYIGHSQGTLTMFSKLSEDQKFATKLKAFYALAPIGTVKDIKGLIKFGSDYLFKPLDIVYKIFGSGEFLPSNDFMNMIANRFCTGFAYKYICANVMYAIGGPQTLAHFNVSRAGVYTAHAPAGTSTQNVVHWAQMVRGRGVPKYDYGSDGNLIKYGHKYAPTYDYNKITGVPIHLYWSDADWLADPTDVQKYILKKIHKNIIVSNNRYEDYNHLDWIWGKTVIDDIHVGILSQLIDPTSSCPL